MGKTQSDEEASWREPTAKLLHYLKSYREWANDSTLHHTSRLAYKRNIATLKAELRRRGVEVPDA